MLDINDLEYIRNSRKEMQVGRLVTITIERVNAAGRDPITGEPIESKALYNLPAIVKPVTSGEVAETLTMINGVKVVIGDVLVKVNTDDVPAGIGALTFTNTPYAVIDGRKFALISVFKRGIGVKTRYECIYRAVT